MAEFHFLLLFFILCFSTAKAASFDVSDFGAKPNGKIDSAGPFRSAWAAACAANEASLIVVPKGRHLVSKGAFYGPCNNTITIFIFGSIVAGSINTNDTSQNWFVFRYVNGLSIHRGAFDGRGEEVWACKEAGGKNCANGLTTLSINHCKNVLLNGLTLLNSQYFHISIFGSEGVTIQNTKIIAPGNSPNTDGIHIGMSTAITITTANIKTGDDCISIGPGSFNVYIDGVTCGPGHGISIGSLAELLHEEGVRNVTVKRVVLKGTTNGLRIKSYARPSIGFVNGVSFRQVIMHDVDYPIIIDQNYCSSIQNCPKNISGTRISNIEYNNIQGTSATPVAVKFDCSPRHQCNGIKLKDINLKYKNQSAKSFCKLVHGTKFGFIVPPVSCF